MVRIFWCTHDVFAAIFEQPLPSLKTKCGSGMGMAVCPALGLLVTSNHDDNT